MFSRFGTLPYAVFHPGEVLAPGERLDIGVTAQSPKAHFATDAVVGLRRPQVTFAEAETGVDVLGYYRELVVVQGYGVVGEAVGKISKM